MDSKNKEIYDLTTDETETNDSTGQTIVGFAILAIGMLCIVAYLQYLICDNPEYVNYDECSN